MNTKKQPSPQDIISFWYAKDMRESWFSSTPVIDSNIRENFEDIWKRASAGEFDDWKKTADGCLALVIVFDQLPLNMYRNQARSFQTEQQAIAITKHAIQKGLDKQLPAEQLPFLFMPLMHSENIKDQKLSIKMFEAINSKENLRFAQHHYEIIKKYGRFPHRNVILKRESTKQEIDYLNSKQAFKG